MAYNVSLQDCSPLISYEPAGAWNDSPQVDAATSSYSGSSFHTTATRGASLSFSFNGTGVWLYGGRRPGYGTYSISLDGQHIIDDDASSSTPALQQLLGAATGLEMGLHQVTLTNTGSILDLDYMVFESSAPEDVTPSTITFDDTDSSIVYDSHWTKGDYAGFYNNTVHYTQSPDASFHFSFTGDAIAIYGTVAPSMGNYTVNLDGIEHQFNGGSDGAVRALHEQILMYFANDIGARPHNLVLTANPSEPGGASFFELDAITVLSTSSGPGNSTSVRNVPPSAISQRSLNPTSTLTPISVLAPASRTSTHLTKKGLIAGGVSAGVICLLAIAFLFLFCCKRHSCDPPSYKKNKAVKVPPTPITPGLPIQDVEKYAGLDGDRSPIYPSPYASYHESVSSRSLHGSYNSNYETESNRFTMFSLARSTHLGHRRHDSEISLQSDVRSSFSSTSDESCRILINSVPIPPQFRMPRMPVPSVPPLRPSRKRETMQIPF